MVITHTDTDTLGTIYFGIHEAQPTKIFESNNSEFRIVGKGDIITVRCTSYEPMRGRIFGVRIQDNKKSQLQKLKSLSQSDSEIDSD